MLDDDKPIITFLNTFPDVVYDEGEFEGKQIHCTSCDGLMKTGDVMVGEQYHAQYKTSYTRQHQEYWTDWTHKKCFNRT